MARVLNESESHLIANLGVYGCWILKHGKQLPEGYVRTQLRDAYQHYLDTKLAKPLMAAIDKAVSDLQWEPVGTDYETALQDLIETRKAARAAALQGGGEVLPPAVQAADHPH